jgi:hypothetical protein
MSEFVESQNAVPHGGTTLTLLVDHKAAIPSAYFSPSSFPVFALTKWMRVQAGQATCLYEFGASSGSSASQC